MLDNTSVSPLKLTDAVRTGRSLVSTSESSLNVPSCQVPCKDRNPLDIFKFIWRQLKLLASNNRDGFGWAVHAGQFVPSFHPLGGK